MVKARPSLFVITAVVLMDTTETGGAGVWWHRAKDFTSSWQFLTLLSLAALALAALVAGAADWRDRGQLWATLSAGLTAVALVAHVALWAP
jgi:hypothetical protein